MAKSDNKANGHVPSEANGHVKSEANGHVANGHVPSDTSSSKTEDSYWEDDSSKNVFIENSQQAKLPGYIGQTVLSVLIFVMGASMRGT